jgi:hypothetical protein
MLGHGLPSVVLPYRFRAVTVFWVPGLPLSALLRHPPATAAFLGIFHLFQDQFRPVRALPAMLACGHLLWPLHHPFIA